MNDYPSFRDLYEAQRDTDTKLEKVNSRISRIEKGMIILALLVASPKLGGPSAAGLVASVLQNVS